MDVIDRLIQEIGIQPVYQNYGMTLVSQSDFPALVNLCEQRQIFISGIEGFRLVGNKVEADLDLIADFSSLTSVPWQDRCREAAEESRFFLDEVASDPAIVLELSAVEQGSE